MPKPGGDPSFGISLGDVLRLPKRHPACRWREAQPGSCTERENLDGDAKGKSTSGYNREAESTDAPASVGLLRSSDAPATSPPPAPRNPTTPPHPPPIPPSHATTTPPLINALRSPLRPRTRRTPRAA